MMGNFFVHIGLPKTATSTLQTDVFPKLQDEKLKYLGVDGDRREGKSSEIYYLFINAVESGREIECIRNKISDSLRECDLLLSEEMLTVSSATVPWQVKLDRVAEILSGFDYTVIVSVREPVSAMFSYYIELYPRFAKMGFVESAMSHNDMFIYHYEKLLQKLNQAFGVERLHFVRFEDITQNNIEPLIKLLIGNRKHGQVTFGIHNSRVKKKGKVVSRYKVTPYTLLVAAYRKMGLRNIKLIHKVAHAANRRLLMLDKLSLRTVKVPLPSENEIETLKANMLNEGNALLNRFGIRYY